MQSPCSDGYSCSYDDVLVWYTGNVTTRPNTLHCKTQTVVNIGDNWACANRQASKNLVSGTYPKECLSNTDCALLDGTTNDCVCTPRGSHSSGFCRPDLSSSYFENYWDLCTLGGSKIKDAYTGYFWFLKSQYSVYFDVTDLPACAQNLWEFTQLKVAETGMAGSGTALALGVVALIVGY